MHSNLVTPFLPIRLYNSVGVVSRHAFCIHSCKKKQSLNLEPWNNPSHLHLYFDDSHRDPSEVPLPLLLFFLAASLLTWSMHIALSRRLTHDRRRLYVDFSNSMP